MRADIFLHSSLVLYMTVLLFVSCGFPIYRYNEGEVRLLHNNFIFFQIDCKRSESDVTSGISRA